MEQHGSHDNPPPQSVIALDIVYEQHLFGLATNERTFFFIVFFTCVHRFVCYQDYSQSPGLILMKRGGWKNALVFGVDLSLGAETEICEMMS